MTDTITKERRSYVMSRIRSRDTKPEMVVRRSLFSRGLRFRVNARFGDGREEVLFEEKNNYQRLRKYPVGREDVREIRFEPLETWGAQEYRLFAFEAAQKAAD